MKLAEYLDLVGYDVAFWLTAYRDPQYPLEQLGAVTQDVTAKLRTAAIIVLLTKGDSDSWFHNLIRSGRCRQAYLQRLASAGIVNDHHQASARLGPFLDAVAASQFSVARQIAALSPAQWLRGHEYEEDYLYAQALHELIASRSDAASIASLLERMASVLAGKPDARLDVVRAMAARDQAGFEASFERLLAERSARIEAEKARHRIEEPQMVADRQVFVDGLALLQIATRLGLAIQREYLYCPSAARVAMQRPFPGE